MSCKIIAHLTYDSATAQPVAAGASILFPSVVSNSDCVQYDGVGGVKLLKPGTYNVFANFTATATAAGDEGVQMQINGANKPGAVSRGTAAAVGDETPLAFNDVLTVCCPETLTFKSVTASSFIVANVIVEKIG